MDQEELDHLNLTHAAEAIEFFTRFARRLNEHTHGQEEPILVLYRDGSGHIEDRKTGKEYKSFGDLSQLAKKLSK